MKWNGFAEFDTYKSTPGHLVFTDPQSRAMQCWILCLLLAAKVHQDRLNAGPNFWRPSGPAQSRFHSSCTSHHRLSESIHRNRIWNIILFISGVFCGRKYLVTYPSSRRRMLWDLLGLMLVIWAPWLQRIADPSLQWGQVLSCIVHVLIWFIIATIAVWSENTI